jgi:hypothetical protein
VAVALPRLQYRVVAPRAHCTNTILQTAQPENGYAVIRLRAHAPLQKGLWGLTGKIEFFELNKKSIFAA